MICQLALIVCLRPFGPNNHHTSSSRLVLTEKTKRQHSASGTTPTKYQGVGEVDVSPFVGRGIYACMLLPLLLQVITNHVVSIVVSMMGAALIRSYLFPRKAPLLLSYTLALLRCGRRNLGFLGEKTVLCYIFYVIIQ